MIRRLLVAVLATGALMAGPLAATASAEGPECGTTVNCVIETVETVHGLAGETTAEAGFFKAAFCAGVGMVVDRYSPGSGIDVAAYCMLRLG